MNSISNISTTSTRMAPRGSRRQQILSLILVFFLVSLYLWKRSGLEIAQQPSSRISCRELPGASDTLVVLRTGASEIAAKLPTQLDTTLSCVPHYTIFSDHDEVFDGQHVRDALETVSENIRLHHPDFELYRRVQRYGRAGLKDSELAGNGSIMDAGAGKAERPGWKLDKWKFLPMLNATHHLYPDFRWYFFMEPDTAVFWTTLLKFERELDYRLPYYMGAQINIGPVEFAHGGSGFLVSRTALRRVVKHFSEHKSEWESFTDGHWAGDCVAGKAFKDADAEITRTWPIIQGDHPGVFPWGRNDNNNEPVWCSPSATYHHLSTEIVEELWRFEQDWRVEGGLAPRSEYLRYRDVFNNYIMPRMKRPRLGWDSKCLDLQTAAKSMEECSKVCYDNPSCVQYQFDSKSGECATSKDPRLGEIAPDRPSLYSAWLYDRIEDWQKIRPKCQNDHWIIHNE